MERDPEYHPYHNTTPSNDEQKRRAARQLARLDHLKLLPANINEQSYKRKVKFLLVKSQSSMAKKKLILRLSNNFFLL